MATIGRPEIPNRFDSIGMMPSESNLKKDILAKVTGAEPSGVKFVDRKKHNVMGKDEFLKLLMTQIKNQDPMDPMDQKKFSAELAQFSQLEQLTNMNTKLENMGANAPTESKFYAASFLGKKVYTAGKTIENKGSPVDIDFTLDKNADKVQIRVLDDKGNLVARMENDNVSKGEQSVIWDGKQLDSYPAANGKYNVEIKAWDDKMQSIPVKMRSSGVVNAVSFEKGEALLTLDDGSKVYLRDVEKFENPGVESNQVTSPSLQSKNIFSRPPVEVAESVKEPIKTEVTPLEGPQNTEELVEY